MNKTKMSLAVEIIIVVIFLILIIVGIILAVYFSRRNENSPTEPGPRTPTNPGETGSFLPTTPVNQSAPGISGASGPFSINSENNTDNYFYVNRSQIPPGVDFYNFEVENNVPSRNCRGFAFFNADYTRNSKNIPGALIWSLDTPETTETTEDILLGAASDSNGSEVGALNPVKAPNAQYSWIYNPENKTWCLRNSPNLCIAAEGTGTSIRLNTLPNPVTPEFQWNILDPLNSPCTIPR
jgi:hypothetical protein